MKKGFIVGFILLISLFTLNGCIGECEEDWECGDWSECINGKQKRGCSDLNKCGTYNTNPITLKSCCIESWSCTDWSDCSNGKRERSCTDNNFCGTKEEKPITSKSCDIITEDIKQDKDFTICNNQACYFNNIKTCNPAIFTLQDSTESIEYKIEGKVENDCKLSTNIIESADANFKNLFMECYLPLNRLQDAETLLNDEITLRSICQGSLIDFVSDTCNLMKISGNIDTADFCFKLQAESETDKSICEKIVDSSLREECNNKVEEKILTEQTIQEGDASSCEILETESNRDECYSELALEQLNVELCKKISFSILKDGCIQGIANVKKDENVCNEFTDESKKQKCISTIEILNGGEPFCETKATQEEKNSCFYTLATASKNGEICNRIVDDSEILNQKDLCFQIIAIKLSDSSYCDNIERLEQKSRCELLASV